MTETNATAPSGPRWPEGRYGHRREPQRRSRLRVAAVAAAVAAAGGLISWQLYSAYGESEYSASVTRFTDVTDRQVVVTFLVRMPADATAICVVRARDAAGTEVGREEVTVTPGPQPSRTVVTHTLTTSARPVTGEVQGCRAA